MIPAPAPTIVTILATANVTNLLLRVIVAMSTAPVIDMAPAIAKIHVPTKAPLRIPLLIANTAFSGAIILRSPKNLVRLQTIAGTMAPISKAF